MNDREYEMNQEGTLEEKLMNDEDFFLDYFYKDIEEATEKIEIVKDLYRMYGHEFDIRVLEE